MSQIEPTGKKWIRVEAFIETQQPKTQKVFLKLYYVKFCYY